MKNRFEQLIQYIINEDEEKAKELFHEIVINESRKIYESLVEDDIPVQAGRGGEEFGDEITDHQNVIDGDETGDEFSNEFDDSSLDGEEGAGKEDDLNDRVMDLEDAIDELKAEFDSLMNDEAAEEENFPGIHDSKDGGGAAGDEDDEFDSADGEEGVGEEGVGEEGAGEEGNRPNFGESRSRSARKSPADLMREYVEKVGMDWGKNNPTEGDAVGAGGQKTQVNTKSTQISGKNDMGGTTANIARGGSETNPDGKPVPKPNNAYTKGQGRLGQEKYENSPGAGTKGYKNKVGKKSETDGQPVGAKNTMGGSQNDKSIGQVTDGKPGFKG
jgi:hypothetical protein